MSSSGNAARERVVRARGVEQRRRRRRRRAPAVTRAQVASSVARPGSRCRGGPRRRRRPPRAPAGFRAARRSRGSARSAPRSMPPRARRCPGRSCPPSFGSSVSTRRPCCGAAGERREAARPRGKRGVRASSHCAIARMPERRRCTRRPAGAPARRPDSWTMRLPLNLSVEASSADAASSSASTRATPADTDGTRALRARVVGRRT